MVIAPSGKIWGNAGFHPRATSGGATNARQEFSSATPSSPNFAGFSSSDQ